MSKLYSYYKDGFYAGIWGSKSGECLQIAYLNLTQQPLSIPTVECTMYDGLGGEMKFEDYDDQLFYQGEYLDGVVEWYIEDEDDTLRTVSILIEFPTDVPDEFYEGFVGSGFYFEEV